MCLRTVSSRIGALELIIPHPPSWCCLFSLRMQDFRWIPLNIVKLFFFCLDIGFISSFGKLIIPDSYFMTSRAFVLVAWILFLPFSWLFSTCLTLPGIWLWLTFIYLCQDSPSPVGYHSACSYPAYLLFCLLVTPPIHYINRLPSLCIHSVRLIQSEWHPNVLPIDPSEVDQCVLLSWLMSSKYRWLYLLRPRQNIGRLCITLVNSTLDGDMCYCLGVGW